MYPNLIIAGAAKSGSTTIYDLLKEHPEICMSNVKEPNIFLHDRGKEKNYYKKYFTHYNKEKWIGEATVAYFIEKDVPKRIFAINPDTKLIFTLRNPVNQFFSNYWHRVRKGHETRKWEDALRGDVNDDLFACGFYYSNLQYFLKYFPKESMHFVIFEELINNMDREYERLLTFLNLYEESAIKKYPWSNRGSVYKNKTVGFTINRIRNTKTIYNLIPPFLRPAGKSFLQKVEKINKSSIDKVQLKNSDKAFLKNVYQSDTENLQTFMDRRLPWE